MTDIAANHRASRLATQLAFFGAGFGVACWAPLIPFAKARLGVDDAQLGLLLLCVGIGSLVAMPITGMVSARMGGRSMVLLGGMGLGVLSPLLAHANSPIMLGVTLLGFGASLGTIDVAMNAQAVEVEAAAKKPLMSGFHAMFSIGGIAGAGAMTLLLMLTVPPLWATLCTAALTLLVIGASARGLLRTRRSTADRRFVFPKGVVLLIAVLAAVTFLVEGAMLDWSALLTIRMALVTPAQGGLGFMLFSVAMAAGRLLGDVVVSGLGPRRVLVGGGVLTLVGFITLLVAPLRPVAMTGFVLIGLGASNVVPVLFSAAGRQKLMSPAVAIAAITTTAYAGVLAGPALVGFVARIIGLGGAFWLLAALMCFTPIFAKAAAQEGH